MNRLLLALLFTFTVGHQFVQADEKPQEWIAPSLLKVKTIEIQVDGTLENPKIKPEQILTLEKRSEIDPILEWLSKQKMKSTGFRHRGTPPQPASVFAIRVTILLNDGTRRKLMFYGYVTMVINDDLQYQSVDVFDIPGFPFPDKGK